MPLAFTANQHVFHDIRKVIVRLIELTHLEPDPGPILRQRLAPTKQGGSIEHDHTTHEPITGYDVRWGVDPAGLGLSVGAFLLRTFHFWFWKISVTLFHMHIVNQRVHGRAAKSSRISAVATNFGDAQTTFPIS